MMSEGISEYIVCATRHVWASWRGIYHGENNRIAVDFENMVRLLRDPAAPIRKEH